MAEEELTLRMRERGALLVKRSVDGLGRAVRKLGRDSDRSSRNVGIFSRALTIMKTRAVIATVVVVALGAATAAVVPSVLLLTAGLLALGATFAPAMLLGLGVMLRFAETVNQAGSAASELSDVLNEFKRIFTKTIGPAADIVMRGISNSLVALMPIVESFAPVFRQFAGAITNAMGIATKAIMALAPELKQLFSQSATLLAPMVQMFVPFIAAFIRAAQVGLPVARQLLYWMTAFGYWLLGAIEWMDRFAHSAQAANIVHTVFRLVADAAQWVWDVLSNLAQIAYKVASGQKGLAVILGGALLGALRAVRDVLKFVNDHFDQLAPVILPVITAIVTLTIVLKILIPVMALINLLMDLNPFVLAAALVLALAAGFYVLYQRSEAFRQIISVVWTLLKWSPIGQVIQLTIFLAKKLWAARGAFVAVGRAIKTAVVSAIDFVVPKIEWLIDKIKWVLRKAKAISHMDLGVGKAVGKGLGFDPTPGFNIPGLAVGGPVDRGSPYVVGERGPELFVPERSGTIVPNHQAAPASMTPDSFLVDATFVMPDGSVLAKQTVKASRRKKAVR